MAGRRAGGAPALWRRVRWANVGRLAALLAAGLLLVTGGRGCRAGSPLPAPPDRLGTQRPSSERPPPTPPSGKPASPARGSYPRRESKAGTHTRPTGARGRAGDPARAGRRRRRRPREPSRVGRAARGSRTRRGGHTPQPRGSDTREARGDRTRRSPERPAALPAVPPDRPPPPPPPSPTPQAPQTERPQAGEFAPNPQP
jgi:hypothetical protein